MKEIGLNYIIDHPKVYGIKLYGPAYEIMVLITLFGYCLKETCLWGYVTKTGLDKQNL